jgi:hypothetical protein
LNSKIIALNLALLAALGLLGWQVRREYREAKSRQRALLNYNIRPVAAPPMAPLPKAAPVAGATYAEVAQKNLFSRDRNPDVIVDPPAPPPVKPIPAFPVARGVMLWEGVPATVVLSEKSGGPQKSYRVGDKIGDWTIASIDNTYVVFTWDGKDFKKRLDELLDRTPIQVAEAPTANAPAPPPPPANLAGKDGPSDIDMGGVRACIPGDRSPVGAVVDGWKKVVTNAPMGPVCRWEPVK